MQALADFWLWQGWTAIGAMATIGAAIVVGYYTWETMRLRRTADEQLEAQIAPMVMLKSGRAAAREAHNCIGRLDRAEGKPELEIHISNEGRGPALGVEFDTKPNADGSIDMGYELSAIPPGKFITVAIARQIFLGDESVTNATRSFRVRFSIDYQSVAQKRYRTLFRVRGWNEHGEPTDQSSLEYERLDKALKSSKARLAGIAKRGSLVCFMCGDELRSGRPLREIGLSRRAARMAKQARDPVRAPRWKIGLGGTFKITTCLYCAERAEAFFALDGGDAGENQ
ncbi:MAG: hypothetical protein L0170_01290 [Acidobacteria bacterium]|nr:hypothetical protein [Acidobacteriota bacterium]